jgi:soluble lytic murein transglycosylase
MNAHSTPKPASCIPVLLLVLLLPLGCAVADGQLDAGGVVGSESSADPAYHEAASALIAHRFWRARTALAPALADSARRTPEVVLLAADLAAAGDRWMEVSMLLSGEEWIDTMFDGRARLLLARAALGRNAPTTALRHARAALDITESERLRGRALALSGRAFERLDRDDSARVAYDSAAEYIPDIADWLYLRSAGLTRNGAERDEYYERLTTEVAQRRARWSEALKREKLGQAKAAIRLYDSLGTEDGRLASMRLRAATAKSRREQAKVRAELLAFIDSASGSEDARTMVEALDSRWRKHPAREDLIIARSAARSGPLSRSAAGFARAFAKTRASDDDRFLYGTVLARMRRSDRAARQFALIKPPSPLAGDAAYQRARLLLRRRQRAAGIAALRAVARKYADDTSAAASALMHLADLSADKRRDAEARLGYLAVAERYPTSEQAPRALFQAAILSLARKKIRSAAAELDTLVDRYPDTPDAGAVHYWSGRALATLGDSARARDRWLWVTRNEPLSYYGALAAQRLGEEPWAPDEARDRFDRYREVDDAMSRADLLQELGMLLEARLEYDALVSDERSLGKLLAAGNAFRARGMTARAIDVGRRTADAGVNDARAYRLFYPLVEPDIVAAEAAQRGIEPSLVAAIIRQESNFNPHAKSRVGARGLMQVMPSVGRRIARAEDIPAWRTALLYQPDVNLHIGTTHLQAFTGHYDHPARALAAYNAGASRVAKWSRFAGARDPELFVERIPFPETKNYVKVIMRNKELYRSLYDWPTKEEGN